MDGPAESRGADLSCVDANGRLGKQTPKVVGGAGRARGQDEGGRLLAR